MRQLSQWATTTEPIPCITEGCAPETRALPQENPRQQEVHIAPLESGPHSWQLEKAQVQQRRTHVPPQRPSAAKNKIY